MSARWSVVRVFDRAAKIRQRARAPDLVAPPLCDYVKDEIGWRLADRVFDIKRRFESGVDIGCGRGHVSKHLDRETVRKLTLCDSNRCHLDTIDDWRPEGVEVVEMLVDEERLELEENAHDLIVSSLCMHWINDLPRFLAEVMKALRPDGVFVASLFGEETLFELRSSLQLADLERGGGVAPRVSPFTRVRDVGGLLDHAGFALQTIDVDEVRVRYPSAFELAHDLRAMGESNANVARQPRLDRDAQFAAAAIYERLYGERDEATGRFGVPATFQVINALGWKPDPKQPKAAERGSQTASLKDLGKLSEIAQKKGTIELDGDANEKKDGKS